MMKRRSRKAHAIIAALIAILLLTPMAAAHADSSGGGTQRWSITDLDGAPGFSTSVVTSPDGSTVFVTGTSEYGLGGKAATSAYDASTGARKWAASYPATGSLESARGTAMAISPDGATLFVTGLVGCSRCGRFYAHFMTIAYEVATGDQIWASRDEGDGGAYAVVVSPDGRWLVVSGQADGGNASRTIAYDPATGEALWAIGHPGVPTHWGGGLVVSPGSDLVYVATGPGSSRCGFNVSAHGMYDGSRLWSSRFDVGPGPRCGRPTAMRLSPDGRTGYVTGRADAPADAISNPVATVAFDARSGLHRWTHVDDRLGLINGDAMSVMEVSPDGTKVHLLGTRCLSFSSVCPMVATTYDAVTGARLWISRYMGGGSARAADLAVSADGSTVVAAGSQSPQCLDPCTTTVGSAIVAAYDARTGAERWATTAEDSGSFAVAIDSDGAGVYLAGSVAAAYNNEPGPGVVQESDPQVTIGGWKASYNRSALGGAFRASRLTGGSAVFSTPAVSELTWVTRTGPDQGRARVIIDGSDAGTFDLYSSGRSSRSISFDGLASIPHAVEVRVLGTKNEMSTDHWVAVDAFRFPWGSAVAEESSVAIAYTPWTSRTMSSASGSAYRVSSVPGTKVSFTFVGSSISWITATGPMYGKARVVIDGEPRVVDLYRRASRWQVPMTFAHLGDGAHRIHVVPLGRRNPASSASNIVVDAFVVP